MKKEQTFGALREILKAASMLFFAGWAGWPAATALAIALLTAGWSIYFKEGWEKISTSIRSVLSTAPGLAVAIGWIDMDQAVNLTALLLPTFSLIWSVAEKDESGNEGGGSSGKLGLFAALIISAIALPSCNVVGSAITGQAIPSTPVQRSGHGEAPVVHISSSDLALAEMATEGAILLGRTPPVHGLYDAGYLAEAARNTVIEATK